MPIRDSPHQKTSHKHVGSFEATSSYQGLNSQTEADGSNGSKQVDYEMSYRCTEDGHGSSSKEITSAVPVKSTQPQISDPKKEEKDDLEMASEVRNSGTTNTTPVRTLFYVSYMFGFNFKTTEMFTLMLTYIIQHDLTSQVTYTVAPKKMPRLQSSVKNLARIDEIRANIAEMGNHDLRNLLQSDVRLSSAAASLFQDNIKGNYFDKRIEAIGNDSGQWKQLVEKHPNMRKFMKEYQMGDLQPKAKGRAKTASHALVLGQEKAMREARKRKAAGKEEEEELDEDEHESPEMKAVKKARVEEWMNGEMEE